MLFEQILQSSKYDFDLGSNTTVLYNKVKPFKNAIIVELGVRNGISSSIFLEDSEINNNKVYGVDLGICPNTGARFPISPIVSEHKNFTFIQSESIEAGTKWNNGPIDFLFVDTLHIKEQVLGELKAWFPFVKEGGVVGFHDTNWGEGHYEYFKNKTWYGRPDDAIKEYFNVDSLNIENEFVKVENYPDSYGMTFVHIKKKDYKFGRYVDWEEARKYYILSRT